MYNALTHTAFETHPTTNTFKWIWALPIYPKVKTFIWLLNHNRLPSCHFLNSINIITNATCHYCQDGDETLQHIFLKCPNAKTYWASIGLQSHIMSLTQRNHPQQWLHNLINLKILNLPYEINLRTFLPLSMWNIWLVRNRNLYEQGHATVSKSHTIQQSIEYAYMAAPQHT